jgi:hypothetical protein
MVERDATELCFAQAKRAAHPNLLKEDVQDGCNGVTSTAPTGVNNV